ncbi:hypothetical protein S7711_10320, partial [Stachybotrys chartarum IBT 7711]
MDKHGLISLLQPGTITYEENGARTTIDLSLATANLADRLIRCEVESSMSHDSDHLPIATCMDTRVVHRQTRPRRNWKAMDKKAFTSELEKRLPPRRRPRTKTALDNYVEEIVSALTQAINISVPTSTPCSKAKAGWNEECSKMLAETKRLRRIYSATHTEEAWEAYRVARNKKEKTIKKALRKMHRDTIETAAESPEKLWRVAKWARSRESQVSELTPVIKDPATAQEATTPREKAKLFRD